MKSYFNSTILVILFSLFSTCSQSLIAQIYSPFDYTSSGPLIVDTGTLSINTETGTALPSINANGQTFYGTYETQTAEIEGETFNTNVAIFCFDDININQGITISVSGVRALILLSKGNITLESNLNMGSSNGASDYGPGSSPDGPGTGGGYGGPGQWGFSSSVGWLWPGGRSYGEETLSSILLGGSRGGWGKNGGSPGHGGGAIGLIAANSITLNTKVIVNGGNPALAYWGGGGGSGGSVLMHAPNLNFGANGAIEALGGVCPETMSPGASGSAGRVALYYNQLTGFEESKVSVYSRPGWIWDMWSPDGDGAGTLYMEQPSLTLLSPNGGEKLIIGNTYPIQWTANTAIGISTVVLEYSADNGQNWIELAVAENSGEYDWQLPDFESDQYLVRISDVNGSFSTDTSDSAFTIFSCNIELPADITGDCYVNLEDFALMAATWLNCGNSFDQACQ